MFKQIVTRLKGQIGALTMEKSPLYQEVDNGPVFVMTKNREFDPAYADKIDEVSITEYYYGWCKPGSSTSDETWIVAKKSKTGNVWTLEWANNGVREFSVDWDNRTTHTYSLKKN